MNGITPLLTGMLLLTLVGVFAGIRLAGLPAISRKVLPFSGGLLGGIALFWIVPEIAAHFGWPGASAGLAAGFVVLWLIDRYLYPVCPTCAHTHDHESCSRTLHGFAAPLIIASGLHSFFDGWSLAVSHEKGFESLKTAFVAGVGFHKLPEGLALGALLVAAIGSGWRAWRGAAAAQSMMLAGGSLALVLAPRLGVAWTVGFLAVAAGAFLYLGYHAVDAAYQQKGVGASVAPALAGAVGAAALRTFLPG